MNRPTRIPGAVLVASGILSGILAITTLSYIVNRLSRPSPPRLVPSTATSTANAGASEPRRSTRLRRARHVRPRRNRSHHRSDGEEGGNGNSSVSPLQVVSESEDDQPLWGEDENKNLLSLIYAISENQARKEGYIHRGITCNKCGMSPIRGVRFKCANCVDFDLCEMCESANFHFTTHVFLKIRIPIPPLANPRSALLPTFYPGNEENTKWLLSEEVAQELLDISHFDRLELEALHEQFKSLATVIRNPPAEEGECGIDNETFEQCLGPLGLEKNLITERIFAFFDQDRDGVISFKELVCGLSVLSKGNLDEKIEYAFKGYDIDEDGYISRDELYRMFKSYFYLSMELVRDVVSAMEDEMMDNFEFSASQPVSAAFNVTIPSSPSSPNDSEEGEEQEEGAERRQRPRYPHKEAYFEEQYEKEQQQQHENNRDIPASLSPPPSTGVAASEEIDWSRSKNKQRQHTGGSNSSGIATPKKTWEEKFPIMETMSQDAINEMVDKTFKSINSKREGYISLVEFKQCVQSDSSIVSWFEALGTVF